MEKRSNSYLILMADDDQEDCLLAGLAFEQSEVEGEIRFVGDGQELLEYLRNGHSRPDLILLDLNMPRLDGRAALVKIKEDQLLRDIPVVILTTSRNEKDVKFCLNAGACEFKTKPVEISEWVDVIKSATSHCPA